MKRQIILLVAITISISICLAENPIIQTRYTADPAPLVYNDKVYLYTSHDEGEAATWFTMNNWYLYSTSDMVNWTDHGEVLSYTDFKWAKGDAWAPQCIERNGKFYMYVPMIAQNNRPAIGVAVADSPYGPFYDPINKPLVQTEDYNDIDPTVFIDDDGQAYLYWGNPFLCYVKLNEDMISFSDEIVRVPMTEESFGKREGNVQNRPTLYEEGPWLYKRKNLYYLFWPGGPLPEHIGYSTSNSPTGPWKYGGTVMESVSSFTIHPGVIDFRGKTYYFYHNGGLPGGGGFNRSVCVEEMTFNPDGSIPKIKMTKEGIEKGLQTVNPYIINQAETMAWSEGIRGMKNEHVGVYVTTVRDGSYIKVKDVDFGNKGAAKFFARVGTTHNEKVNMEVRLGGVDGELVCTIRPPRTGGDNRWEIVSADVANVKGVHDVYFVFKSRAKNDLMFFDYWRFAK